VSANVMCGQEGYFGTSAFQVILDYDKITQIKADEWEEEDTEAVIEKGFEGYTNSDDMCSIDKLSIATSNIKAADMGADDGYDVDF
jgi:DNA-directed RNA polymerase II subunit RPB1